MSHRILLGLVATIALTLLWPDDVQARRFFRRRRCRCCWSQSNQPRLEPPLQGNYLPVDGNISLDVRPTGLVCHQGRVYVAAWHDHQILVFDQHSGKPVHQFGDFDTFDFTFDEFDEDGKVIERRTETRLTRPGSMAIVGGKLFVVQTFGRNLLVLDARSMRPIARIPVKHSQGRLAVAPDGRSLYFASNLERAFYVIDARRFTIRRVPYPQGGRGIGAAAVSPDGRLLYLGIQRGAREAGAERPSRAAGPENPLERTYPGPMLAVYDLARRQYIAIKSIGDTLEDRDDDSSGPTAMAFADQGRTLYITMSQSAAGVHVYDTINHRLEKPITFVSTHEVFPWPGCHDIAVIGENIFVSLSANRELAVLDASTRKIDSIAKLGSPVGARPGRLTDSDGCLYVCLDEQRQIAVVDLP